MKWINVSNDEYSNTPEGLEDMLCDHNLHFEFHKYYEEDYEEYKKICRNEEEYDKYMANSVKHILEEVDNVGQVFCELHEHFPNKFKKNTAAVWNWDRQDDRKDGNILIDVYEVTYTKQESIKHIVELIKEHNISQADIFEEVLKTS